MSASVFHWAVLGALVLYVVCLAGIASTGARADEPPYGPPTFYAEPDPEGKPCPAAPAPLAEPPPPSEGEESAPDPDAVQRELRSQRIEAAEICEAQTSSAREVQRRLWWVTAEVRPHAALLETMQEHLANLADARCYSPCPVHLDAPVEIKDFEGAGAGEGITEAQMVELVGSIDASGEASQGALYFIAGLVVSLFLGYCFWRTVQSGT